MTATSILPADHNARLGRARVAVEGLSLGDAFGQKFFYREHWADGVRSRQLPPPPWKYTDDTEMALAICEVLAADGEIDRDKLAATFARRYKQNPYRGYGAGAHEILDAIDKGADWRDAAAAAFAGQGSLGNGGAMRVAPVGAYFADDYAMVVDQARKSAEVTHAHLEGIAGAIAIAVATAWACRRFPAGDDQPLPALFDTVLAHTPESDTRRGIVRASETRLETWEFTAAERLGNGTQVTAPDTAPFCLWSAARNIDDYCEALCQTSNVGGDVDTNCAIVGGIVAMAVGEAGLPQPWLKHREPLAWKSI